jgi:hypothetical protein
MKTIGLMAGAKRKEECGNRYVPARRSATTVPFLSATAATA